MLGRLQLDKAYKEARRGMSSSKLYTLGVNEGYQDPLFGEIETIFGEEMMSGCVVGGGESGRRRRRRRKLIFSCKNYKKLTICTIKNNRKIAKNL